MDVQTVVMIGVAIIGLYLWFKDVQLLVNDAISRYKGGQIYPFTFASAILGVIMMVSFVSLMIVSAIKYFM